MDSVETKKWLLNSPISELNFLIAELNSTVAKLKNNMIKLNFVAAEFDANMLALNYNILASNSMIARSENARYSFCRTLTIAMKEWSLPVDDRFFRLFLISENADKPVQKRPPLA